ncbi:DNA-directed RNA polymerase subunit beta [Paenibacillus marinisediminis]
MDKDQEPYTPAKVISRVERLRPTDKEGPASEPDHTAKEPKKSNAMKWVFRLLIVPMLCILATFGGMMVGFVVLGKGTVSEALDMDTWTHVFKLVFG